MSECASSCKALLLFYQSKARTVKEGVSGDVRDPTVLLIVRCKAGTGQRSTQEFEGYVFSCAS